MEYWLHLEVQINYSYYIFFTIFKIIDKNLNWPIIGVFRLLVRKRFEPKPRTTVTLAGQLLAVWLELSKGKLPLREKEWLRFKSRWLLPVLHSQYLVRSFCFDPFIKRWGNKKWYTQIIHEYKSLFPSKTVIHS